MTVVDKVLAYITRHKHGRDELLVFVHRDVPEAGIQVPAGTVEPGEEIEHALLREIQEETGLTGLQLIAQLAVYEWYYAPRDETQRRHVYHLTAPADLPDTRQGAEGHPGAANYWIFDFYWHPLAEPIDLAGNQGDYLHRLR